MPVICFTVAAVKRFDVSFRLVTVSAYADVNLSPPQRIADLCELSDVNPG